RQGTARLQRVRDGAVLLRNRARLGVRQQRRLAVAHIGEDHSSSFLARICFVTNRIRKILSSSGRSWHVDDLAVNVIRPAVIDASEPAVLDASVAKLGASVRAVKSE